jgi:uncharacterized protein YcaQ
MPRKRLSLAEARRITLAAQGFDRPRPQRATARDLRRVIERLGLLQFDSVNVFDRAHFTVPFSRVGPFDRQRFHRLLYRDGHYTEQWARQASYVPVHTWPLLKPRMARSTRRERFLRGMRARYPEHSNFLDEILEDVRAHGPLRSDEVSEHLLLPKPTDGWGWNWTPARGALEVLLAEGAIAVVNRDSDLARSYDLADRVLPAEHIEREVTRAEANRELTVRGARIQGVGTANEIADCYQIPVRDAQEHLADLVAEGVVYQVEVESLEQPAYLHAEARLPRKIEASALLSPFDPVVRHRARGEWLFGFDYRLEMFVPKPQRRFGYYVLPFLLNDRLAARVDLKADRQAKLLLVQAAYVEDHAKPSEVADALAGELRTAAEWFGLDEVRVERKGSLAGELRRAVRLVG